MILNINEGVFGGPVRNGDLIAVANVVAHLRKSNHPELKFYMKPGSVNSAQFVQEFFTFMKTNTDYFSEQPGNEDLPWKKVNLWDFRDVIGDNVVIKNPLIMVKKIVVFPLFDAPYNTYRNWPQHEYEKLITYFSSSMFDDYEKFICVPEHYNLKTEHNGWKYSTNFMDNIQHIMTAETFVGGDTGTSHFAWALDRSPKNLIYLGSGRGLLHSLPFYLLQGKGHLNKYWLNMEGTTW